MLLKTIVSDVKIAYQKSIAIISKVLYLVFLNSIIIQNQNHKNYNSIKILFFFDLFFRVSNTNSNHFLHYNF